MSATTLELVLSIPLGLVLVGSAIPKLRDPRRFVLATIEYRILPPAPSRIYARLLPPLELAAGLALLGGIAVRATAVLVSFLFITFLLAISVNMARGRQIECHCFGRGARRQIGWNVLGQDILLLGMSLSLARLPGSWPGSASWSPMYRLSNGMSIGICLVAALSGALWLGRTSPYRGQRSPAGEASFSLARLLDLKLAATSKAQRGRK